MMKIMKRMKEGEGDYSPNWDIAEGKEVGTLISSHQFDCIHEDLSDESTEEENGWTDVDI